MEWKLEVPDNRAMLRVRADAAARSARHWASASATRDFRTSHWDDSAMRRIPESGTQDFAAFIGEIPLPATGFVAILGELEFEERGAQYRLSTQIQIVGDARDQ